MSRSLGSNRWSFFDVSLFEGLGFRVCPSVFLASFLASFCCSNFRSCLLSLRVSLAPALALSLSLSLSSLRLPTIPERQTRRASTNKMMRKQKLSHRQYSVNKNVSIYVAFVFGSPLRFTVFWQCRSLVLQLQYWNGRPRRLAGFSFSGSTTLVLERPSPAAGWIFVLWYYNFSTGTAVPGGWLDFRSLVVQF